MKKIRHPGQPETVFTKWSPEDSHQTYWMRVGEARVYECETRGIYLQLQLFALPVNRTLTLRRIEHEHLDLHEGPWAATTVLYVTNDSGEPVGEGGVDRDGEIRIRLHEHVENGRLQVLASSWPGRTARTMHLRHVTGLHENLRR